MIWKMRTALEQPAETHNQAMPNDRANNKKKKLAFESKNVGRREAT